MSHFAKVLDGKVLKVIVAEKEFFDTYVDDIPGTWIQTSYNTRHGKHYDPITGELSSDQTKALRGNYAGVNHIYDAKNDVFYDQQLFPSWTLDTIEWKWVPPTPQPISGGPYNWNEETLSWVKVNIE
jgi:hypothetical protein